MKRPLFLALLLLSFALVASSLFVACSDDSGPSDPDPIADGDSDTADQEEGQGDCTADEKRCDPENPQSVVQYCQSGLWQTWENCADKGMNCENGACVTLPDGDEEEDEAGPEPLEILSTIPTQNEENVPSGSDTVRFNFNQPFEFIGQTYQGAFTLTAEGAQVPSMTATLANPAEAMGEGWYNQFHLVFNAPPEEGIRYTITLHEDNFQAANGERLAEYVLSFRMAGEADGDYEQETDDTPPALERSQPAEGDTVDASRDFILLVFTETLNTRNFNVQQDVTLTGVPAHTVSLDARFTEDNSSMEIDFQTPLQAGTAYSLTLAEGLTDLAGNPLGEFTLHFSTRSE